VKLARPGRLLRGVRRRSARSDLMVVAAAMTAYAAIGLVALLAVAFRFTSALLGADEVRSLAADLAAYVPGPLGIDRAIVDIAAGASTMSWWAVLGAVLPVSLYAEGTVRCLERFSVARDTASRTLRGRLLTVPILVVAALGVAIAATVLRPLIEASFGTGTGPRLLGVFLAFIVLWPGITAVLCLVYRLFTSTAVRPVPLLVGAAAAGSWLAGQSLGYVLTLRYVSRFAAPYGGYAVAGAVAALTFLLYLNHIVVLLGFLVTLTLQERAGEDGSDR
jgi:membrane protein